MHGINTHSIGITYTIVHKQFAVIENKLKQSFFSLSLFAFNIISPDETKANSVIFSRGLRLVLFASDLGAELFFGTKQNLVVQTAANSAN